MNDPIPFFWDGAYHIFFQHNPNGAFWGAMHWGHALSRDLVRWQPQPLALTPQPGGVDQDGCFTGCVVERDGRFYLFYTGIPQLEPLTQAQCLAVSDDLISWTKDAANPLIKRPAAKIGACFRDPHVWREGQRWRMIVGSEQPDDRGGAALLFASDDMRTWRYEDVLCLGDAAQTGFEFECPDFFALGDRWALLTSRGRPAVEGTHWQVGRYDGRRFTPEQIGRVDGGACYAAKTLLDAAGRRILFGWIQERRPVEEQRAAGWSGALSLPRVLTLLPDRSLGIAPAPELAALRGPRWSYAGVTLGGADGETLLLLDGVAGDALELLIRFRPGGAMQYGALVRCSADGSVRTEVVYDRRTQRLGNAALTLAADEPLTLRIYLDRSIVEAFANDRACLTLRSYPPDDGCVHVGVFARDGEVTVESIEVWQLRPPDA
jgi:beta-fructofuranosidase